LHIAQFYIYIWINLYNVKLNIELGVIALKFTEQSLKNKTRRDLYSYILLRPGLHFNELCKIFKMQKKNMEYHLNILIKESLITFSVEDSYKRFYPMKLEGVRLENVADILSRCCYQNTTPEMVRYVFTYKPFHFPNTRDKKIFNLLKNPAASGIVKYLYFNPGSTRNDISRHLNKHPTTISFHLNKLIKCDVISYDKTGKTKRYDIKNLVNIYMLYIATKTFKPRVLPNGKPDGKVDYDFMDSIFEIVYEIFPHPYHV